MTAAGLLVLAQSGNGFFRNRSSGTDQCVENNGFCPGWIVHHLDRYTTPFVQHLVLVIVSTGTARRRLGAPAALGIPYVREER